MAGEASTIVDATGITGGADGRVRIVRQGGLSREAIEAVLGDLLEPKDSAGSDVESSVEATPAEVSAPTTPQREGD